MRERNERKQRTGEAGNTNTHRFPLPLLPDTATTAEGRVLLTTSPTRVEALSPVSSLPSSSSSSLPPRPRSPCLPSDFSYLPKLTSTRKMTDTPTVPSLLASAHSLNSLLVSLTSPPAFSASPSSSTVAPPPSTLLHPLGPSPSLSPASLPLLKSHLSSTLSHLRASLSHFSTLALPPTPTATETAPTETKDDKARRDKYLTLLRDSAGHEATLLALRERDLTFAERLLLERRAAGGGTAGARSFAVLRPEEKAAKNGRGTLKLLERLGSDLGLAGFRDDEGVEPPPERVTLSLGGKVMVVDIEVVRTGREDEGERVDKVKVAYVAEGNDLVFAQGGDALLALLALPSPAAEEEESAAEEKEQRWQSIRRVLEQLHTLDAATDRTGWDQFAALSELSTNLSASFPYVFRPLHFLLSHDTDIVPADLQAPLPRPPISLSRCSSLQLPVPSSPVSSSPQTPPHGSPLPLPPSSLPPPPRYHQHPKAFTQRL